MLVGDLAYPKGLAFSRLALALVYPTNKVSGERDFSTLATATIRLLENNLLRLFR